MKNLIKEAIDDRRKEMIMLFIKKALSVKVFKKQIEPGVHVIITDAQFVLLNQNYFPIKITENMVVVPLKCVGGTATIVREKETKVHPLENLSGMQRICLRSSFRSLFALGIDFIEIELQKYPNTENIFMKKHSL